MESFISWSQKTPLAKKAQRLAKTEEEKNKEVILPAEHKLKNNKQKKKSKNQIKKRL